MQCPQVQKTLVFLIIPRYFKTIAASETRNNATEYRISCAENVFVLIGDSKGLETNDSKKLESNDSNKLESLLLIITQGI